MLFDFKRTDWTLQRRPSQWWLDPAVTNSRLRVQGNIYRKPQPIWAVKTTVLTKIVRRKSIHE